MKNTYNEILKRLKAEVPELEHIDDNKGQMKYERPPICFPAALLEISQPKRQNINTAMQSGDLTVVVSFCFNYTGMMDSDAFSERDRLKSLEYWDVVEAGKKALQGWDCEEFEELECVFVGDNLKREGYKVIDVIFKAPFREILN